jgi:uncharacterized protein (DUF1778 family)
MPKIIKPEPKTESKVKPTIAMRIRPDVMKLLEEAEHVTGSNRTDLVEKCIQDAIAEVVSAEVARKQEEAKRAAEALKKYKLQQP